MSNNKPIISVVIPVFNVEDYLKRCLDSVLAQDFNSYEVILVDDGSNDSSGIICDEYSNRYSIVRVIHKPNGGLSSARLEGYKTSKGRYLCFLDGDDYVSPTILTDWYEAIISYNCDVAVCAYNFVSSDAIKKCFLYLPNGRITNVRDEYVKPLMGVVINGASTLPSYMWLRLFKKDLLEQSFFVSEREYYLEDLPFNLLVAEKTNKIVVINKANYFYCQNKTSLTNAYRINAWQMRCKLCEFINLFCKRNNVDPHFPLRNQLLNAITYTVKNAGKLGSYKLFRDDIDMMLVSEQYILASKQILIRELSLKNKILFILLRFRLLFVAYMVYGRR